jgi:hypothetical protein
MGSEAARNIALPNANNPRRVAFVPDHVHTTLRGNRVQIEQLEVTVVAIVAALHPSN